MKTIPYYTALAMQLQCVALNKYTSRDECIRQMEKAIDKISIEVFSAKKFIGEHLRLIVFPEYFLTSYPVRESIIEWKKKVAITQSDPLFDRLGQMCRDNDVFISGNYYEDDPNFENIFFQSSFVLDNEGKMILNYRRLNSMYSPTPHDVLDKYIELYGEDSLFPVTQTPLGNLACIASEEILYPEVARCLMMRGAEVFLHSSSEVGSPQLTKKNIAKLARATENISYLVSANSGGISDSGILKNSTDGGSKIVNYDGITLAEAYPGESIVAHAPIHIQALRSYRETVSMKNYIARQRFDLYAPSYAQYVHYPSNSITDQEVNKSQFKTIQQEVISRLYRN